MTRNIAAALREQLVYYSLRANEYDEGYARTGQHDGGPAVNADWQNEMTLVRSAFDALPLRGDIIELAAGTGAWTERLVDRAESLTVLDGSAEMLDRNRARLGRAADSVAYRVVDLFDWHPESAWDACIFGFWLAKVPDERVDVFLRAVADALSPSGVVCCIDKAAATEPVTELVTRRLNDGRQFTIVDHPRPPGRIAALFAKAGLDVEVRTFGQRFCLAWGTKATSA